MEIKLPIRGSQERVQSCDKRSKISYHFVILPFFDQANTLYTALLPNTQINAADRRHSP